MYFCFCKMKIKEKIAKGICLTTVLLLLFNVFFSLSVFSTDTHAKLKDNQLKITNLIESSDVIVFEKEDFEDAEDFEDFFPFSDLKSNFRFNLTKGLSLDLSYSNYHFSIITLAKWLEVRHILI